MRSRLERRNPDGFLVAEQDTLLFFNCFQTARVSVCLVGGEVWVEEEKGKKKKNNNRCFLAVHKNAATVHKMGHYPSTVYHYVVDRSMALKVMILCYSKHKALRQSPCLLLRLQRGSTRGKGAHGQEGRVHRCVCVCLWVTFHWEVLCFPCLCAGEGVKI